MNDISTLIKELSVLEVKPNQALCIKFNTVLDAHAKNSIGKSIQEYLNCKVIVVDPQVELSVIEVADEDSNN